MKLDSLRSGIPIIAEPQGSKYVNFGTTDVKASDLGSSVKKFIIVLPPSSPERWLTVEHADKTIERVPFYGGANLVAIARILYHASNDITQVLVRY